jgi:hypothetical protein
MIRPMEQNPRTLVYAAGVCVKNIGSGRMAHTGQFEVYRRRAAQCTELAQNATDSHAKLVLLDTAQAWISLAEQADKNSQTVLVYATPQPPQHVAPNQNLQTTIR